MASKAAKPTAPDTVAKKASAIRTPSTVDAKAAKPAKPPAKPSPRKAAAPSRTKVTATRKTTTKKATTAKKAKTPKAKAPTAKTPKAKAKTAPKPSAKSAQSAALQADLKTLEARLKRADTLTRKSVTSLETIVSTLEARMKTTSSTQKAALTRSVNALGARLDEQVAHTRQAVRAELKTALAQGGLDTLRAAMTAASARLDAAEIAQAESITKINRHLADMARAVDARFEQEARDRARDIAGVKDRLAEAQSAVDARIDGVERDSADALTRVGDQVSEIHDKLENRRQLDSDDVTEKVNELALQTQAEFEAFQAKLEARIGQIEHRHASIDPQALSGVAEASAERLRDQLSTQIAQLQTRIDELERDAVAQAMNMAQVAQSAQPAATPALTAAHAPALTPALAPAPFVTPPQQTPVPAPVMPAANSVQDNPYASALDAAQPRESHVPVEFDPQAFASQPRAPEPASVVAFPQAAPYQPASAPAPMATPTPAPPVMAPPMPINTPVNTPVQAAPDMAAEPEFEAAPIPDAPYANPAYAETGAMAGDSPKAIRIGGDEKPARKFSLPDLPVSGRNLKLGALMVGVSAIAVITAKSLLGGNPAPNPDGRLQPMLDAGTTPASQPFTPPPPAPETMQIVSPSEATAEPIGQYVEAAPVEIASSRLDTLESAVENGDPIAQFQMGLARIEAGDAAAGAALLQKAADADQPAALYRLAKLYEAGEGVDADADTARRLIERAARGGNRIAMHDLALYHTEGRGGLEANMLTARSWFEQAAMRGVIDSQFNLAVLSESSDGGLVPNREDALFWYSVAASQGDQFAVSRREALVPTFDADAKSRVDARIAAFTPRPIDEEANGIFGDQPWTRKSAGNGARDDVRTAQSLLARLGYEVGGADGLMGARTRSAVMEFEKANGLPPTGRINDALIDRLELAAGV